MEGVEAAIQKIAHELWQRIERTQSIGYTLVLKVKYSDFKQITRSLTVDCPVSDEDKLMKIANDLIRTIPSPLKPIRLLGLTLSSLKEEEEMNSETQQMSFPF